ncbi:MAG: response regulator [Lachnospiraceae bacterium]|nr:response regulator [Lachnospiraceae bacterium]
MEKNKKIQLVKKMRNNIIVLSVFILVVVLCINILNQALWDNANEMGLTLVENYTASEESKIRTCESILNIGVNYLAERERADISIEELRQGLYPFMDELTDMYGEENIQVYGMAFNATQVVSNNPEIEERLTFDITGTDYYRGAVEAAGDIYISPAYTDAITGLSVVTMCKVVPATGSFLAIDIKPSYFEHHNENLVLPKDSSYYLVGSQGALLYYNSCWDYQYEDFQNLVNGYVKDANYEKGKCVLENVTPADGIVRNIYFHHMSNGWTGILTIPKNEILSGANTFRYICILLVLLGTAVCVFQVVREYLNEKHNQALIEENDRMAEQTRIYRNAMDSMARACRSIYYVDMKTQACEVVYPRNEGKIISGDYEKEMSVLITGNIVMEDNLEQVRDFLKLSNIRQMLFEKDHIEQQFKRKRPDSKEYEWCSIAITTAERTRDGKLAAITLAVRNIDDVISREEEQREMLALAVQRAEAANHAKSDFLSRMSHDIRTPMNAILGMTSVAQMHIDEKERVLDALEKITISGKHLLGLINEVLDMSRIESGKVSLTEDAFNLSDTIESLLTVFRAQMEAKGIQFNAGIAKLEHENVVGDDQHLQQIFMNIMGNAVKFTPSGGEISIHIEEKPSHIPGSGYYEFTFQDTGIGMSEEFIQTIFEPFSRAADSRIGKIEGTGLGMSIAVSIARMMDGDIKVESTLGKGSKFVVTVYLKLDDSSEADLLPYAGFPVLVVDDEEDACESACEIIRSLGMAAEAAHDGDEAIERIREAQAEKPFSVAILDWKMPGKDGLETAKDIRSLVGDDISLVILSAYDWADIETEATEVGVNAFIGKPLFKSRLIRVLKEVLGHGDEEEETTALDTFREQDFSGRRVLLVEDNEINIEVAKELLGIVGIQVDMAENGQLAVEAVEGKEPGYYDLIFMDIQMPVMNGYEAAKAIRASGRKDLENIPIVAMTADAFADDIRKAEEAGMNGHVSKPVDIERLEEALKKWIQ